MDDNEVLLKRKNSLPKLIKKNMKIRTREHMECSITQNKIEKFRFLDLTCKVHLYFFQLQGKSSVETNAYIRLIFINIFAI